MAIVLNSLLTRSHQFLMQRWLCTTPMNKYSSNAHKNAETESSNTSESHMTDDEDAYVDEIKNKILSASMEFVHDHGWTRETLANGAQAMGYASTSHSLFPHGAAHLVHYHTISCNAKLAEKLKLTKPQNHIKFIEDAIVSRIEMLTPYKTSWASALGVVMNGKMSIKQIEAILRLSDDICYHAGDRSVDEHWYLRRVAVAGIYQSSEMHWLGNDSKTSDLDDVRKFTANQLKCATSLYEIPQNLSAILTTIRNIIPVNFNR